MHSSAKATRSMADAMQDHVNAKVRTSCLSSLFLALGRISRVSFLYTCSADAARSKADAVQDDVNAKVCFCR